MKDRRQERKKRASHPALLVLEILLAGVALFSLYKVGSILMEYRNSALILSVNTAKLKGANTPFFELVRIE